MLLVEAAEGIYDYAQKKGLLGDMQLNEECYDKLEKWPDALNNYRQKERTNKLKLEQ